MKRIAIFVEGQSEQIFIKRLVSELFGRETFSIVSKKTVGGTSIAKQELVRQASFARDPDYYILINDCGADNRVKSEILDNIRNLNEKGYVCVLGIRDLYPLEDDEYHRLEKGMNYLPRDCRKFRDIYHMFIVVQEIETWFLAETNHLQRVDKRLRNGKFISQTLGFNPYTINPMERKHPSKDLNDIYRLVGKSYTKRYWQVEKLVKSLDFDHIFRNLKYDLPSLGRLINILQKIKNGGN